ncbi:hypothetical protein NBRC116188_03950 [Oceaniserpentilla sp. 4NH20-0058]|uniref:DUF1456 family protein n=1 Tax=Oceaniserpentilla sp. 4NH20-0058 TaxID=3127660 RepID=UPI0031088915
MTNNYILRRLRFTFNYNDHKMVEICALAGLDVSTDIIKTWLKKEEDPEYVRCTDHEMAQFLNGFIIEKRGSKDGQIPKAEYSLNNNIIFRKLKIALNFIDQDILDTLELADFAIGKAELTAFFRKPDHRHFRECQDQILRNFIQGLQLKFTNSTTARPQSNYQALKGKAENKKAEYKNNKGKSKDTKPFLKPKKTSEKVVYKNPNLKGKDESKTGKPEKTKRSKISLKKSDSETSVNQDIWGSKTDS